MPNRPCWAEISTGALKQNWRLLHEICRREPTPPPTPVEPLAIVKADAYGHSLKHCVPAAVEAGARWLGVTSIEEGVAARALCTAAGHPETEILVIGGPFPAQGPDAVAHRLTAVVWEPWQLDELQSAARAAGIPPRAVPVHLELDTGMSRQGVALPDLTGILARFDAVTPLRLDGLMTHLYAADESDGSVTEAQFALLEPMLKRVFSAGLTPTWLHVGNSAALLANNALPALCGLGARFGLRTMARPGLALYGIAPEFTPEEPEAAAALHNRLRPVLEWKTRVVSLRSIAAGQSVGYNGAFVAAEPMRLALLAVGYADGLKRALSNRGHVLLGGRRAPIVGRISMDQTVVDATEIPDLAPGDEAVLLGRQGSERITALDHARWAGTIPWEIFTSISKRVPRVETSA